MLASKEQVGGNHYKELVIQPAEYCQKNNLNFCESSVIKYVTRHRNKNGIQDIKKAIHFLNLLIEYEYSDNKTIVDSHIIDQDLSLITLDSGIQFCTDIQTDSNMNSIDAHNYVFTLTHLGYSDWRLPSLEEFGTICKFYHKHPTMFKSLKKSKFYWVKEGIYTTINMETFDSKFLAECNVLPIRYNI